MIKDPQGLQEILDHLACKEYRAHLDHQDLQDQLGKEENVVKLDQEVYLGHKGLVDHQELLAV